MSAQVLRPIDGLKLPPEHRAVLRPGAAESDSHGNVHHLPRFFYEVASWQEAHEIRLAPHFNLAVSLSPAVLVRPFGSGAGEADDHLHLDLGFLILTPRQCSETS